MQPVGDQEDYDTEMRRSHDEILRLTPMRFHDN